MMVAKARIRSATRGTRALAALTAAVALGVVATTHPANAQTPSEGPEVFVGAMRVEDYGLLPPIVDQLEARSVLRMTVVGFEPDSTGIIEQCSVGGCGNAFPIAFDADGRARIQYLVRDDFADGFETPSRCRAGDPACVVRVNTDDHLAYVSTVFRDPAPPARQITLTPNRDELVAGAEVQITVTGFQPGERVQAMFCVAIATYGPKHCGAPGPVSVFTIADDGVGRTTLAVREGRVGTAGGTCGGAGRCGIVVTHPESAVPEAFAAVGFSNGPAAQYDLTRSIAGLTMATLLVALAVFLVRRTDWRKPTEADTPDLDHASFAEEEP